MGEEISNSAKLAISICIMASLMFIVVTLLAISSNFSRQVVNTTAQSVANTYGEDLSSIANCNQSVPVALIYGRCLKVEDAILEFEIVDSDGTSLSSNVADITNFLSRKAYLDMQEKDNYFKLRLRLTT